MIRTVERCRCCQSIAVDSLVLDRTRRELRCGDRVVRIEPAMAAIVEALLAADGRLIRHERLHHAVYGHRFDGGPDSWFKALQVYVHRLRRTLVAIGAPIVVRTVRGEGYRLEAIGTMPAPAARRIVNEAIEEAEPCPA